MLNSLVRSVTNSKLNVLCRRHLIIPGAVRHFDAIRRRVDDDVIQRRNLQVVAPVRTNPVAGSIAGAHHDAGFARHAAVLAQQYRQDLPETAVTEAVDDEVDGAVENDQQVAYTLVVKQPVTATLTAAAHVVEQR